MTTKEISRALNAHKENVEDSLEVLHTNYTQQQVLIDALLNELKRLDMEIQLMKGAKPWYKFW